MGKDHRLIAAAAVPLACLALAAQTPQEPRPFTSRITLVPVDVRVVDRRGQPVTDLRRDDFTIFENGVAQPIAHFEAHTLVARDASAAPPAFVDEASPAPPQTGRVFLFLFGRGRHSGPSHDLDAAIDFVRQRLLPQDYAAVLAYNRATEFTTDHERVAQVLTRFRDQHEWIEAQLGSRESPLALLYGSPSSPQMDGRYRRITVTVKRPGVSVLYRHGYMAKRAGPPVDRRTFVTYSRIAAAGGYAGEIHDLKLRTNPPAIAGQPGAQSVQLSAFIDTSTIAFTMVNGKHVAALDAVVYCGGEQDKLVGERWQTIDIGLTDANFALAQQIGIPFHTTVPVRGKVRFVKLIVYDYAGDKLGTAVASLK